MTQFSIISINYNNLRGLKRTVKSILSQSYIDFEYIIIDGGSNDGSKEFICELDDERIRALSEPDEGIYDALNKGLDIAGGRHVMFVNSGDIVADEAVLSTIAQKLESTPKAKAIYGNNLFCTSFSGDSTGGLNHISRIWISGTFARYKFLFGWMMPHQTLILDRTLFEKYGGFDTTFRIAADYDWMIRVFYFGGENAINSKLDMIVMEDGGVSNGSVKGVLNSNLEALRAWRKYTLFVPFWIFVIKPVSKIGQVLQPRLKRLIFG